MKAWLAFEGSTRPAGLARILLALVLWSEHTPEFRLFHTVDSVLTPYAIVLFASSILMLVGWKARWTTGLTGVLLLVGWTTFDFYGLTDHFESHHNYLLSLSTLLLAFLPVGHSYSVDRVLAVRAARAAGVEPPPQRADLGGVRLFQLQISALYLFTAYNKSFVTYPERLESIFAFLYFSLDHPGPWFSTLMVVAGFGVVALEYVLGIGFLFRRAIPYMVALGIPLHLCIYWMMPVGTFTVLMFVYYLVLLDADAVGGLLEEGSV